MSRSFVALFALTACGGFGNAFVAAETLAEARCGRAFSCATAYPADAQVDFATLWGADVPSCEQLQGPDPGLRDAWRDAEKAGSISYDKAQARSCADALEAGTCDDFWATTDPDGCAAAFRGTVGRDEVCTIDAECASALCEQGRCMGGEETEDE